MPEVAIVPEAAPAFCEITAIFGWGSAVVVFVVLAFAFLLTLIFLSLLSCAMGGVSESRRVQ